VAITQSTRNADDQLRKKLQNADIGKFKKAVKKVFAPSEEIRAQVSTKQGKKK